MPGRAQQIPESNIWLPDKWSHNSSLYTSQKATGHPVVLTQTWILLTQIKPSQSASPSLQAGAPKQIPKLRATEAVYFPRRQKRPQENIWSLKEKSRFNNKKDEIKQHRKHCTSEPTTQFITHSKVSWLSSYTVWIFKYYPEPSVREFAHNWHREKMYSLWLHIL